MPGHAFLLVYSITCPASLNMLHTRLEEIKLAVSAGAAEIDIVINRQLALENKWEELYR